MQRLCKSVHVAQIMHGFTSERLSDGVYLGPTASVRHSLTYISATSKGRRQPASIMLVITSGMLYHLRMDKNEVKARLYAEGERIIETLKELEKHSLIECSPRHPERVRESSAGRMYRQYMSMLVTVYKAISAGNEGTEDSSPLRDFIKSRKGSI